MVFQIQLASTIVLSLPAKPSCHLVQCHRWSQVMERVVNQRVRRQTAGPLDRSNGNYACGFNNPRGKTIPTRCFYGEMAKRSQIKDRRQSRFRVANEMQ
mmetsp:Transcript_36148/g.76166  ORF Transcript_36148/g.76166 Transcript_36148/m.76166 type:complete len:99 (-) Transcript_36148:300-596(-)